MTNRADDFEKFECSDQRLIFRLVLAEVRRLRGALFETSVMLAKDGNPSTAIDHIDKALGGKAFKFAERE